MCILWSAEPIAKMLHPGLHWTQQMLALMSISPTLAASLVLQTLTYWQVFACEVSTTASKHATGNRQVILNNILCNHLLCHRHYLKQADWNASVKSEYSKPSFHVHRTDGQFAECCCPTG